MLSIGVGGIFKFRGAAITLLSLLVLPVSRTLAAVFFGCT